MLHFSLCVREREREREREMAIWPSPQALFVFSFLVCILLLSVERSTAQAKTDPIEVRALNTIFGRWGMKASTAWNISGELCSGVAIDSTDVYSTDVNPAIKCDCSFNSSTICHITSLKVYALDVAGTIPEELQDLPYLENLNLAQNYLSGPFPASIGNLTSLQYLSVGLNVLSGTIGSELGKLQKLISLGLGTNNFSGSLPPELGNMSRLEQLYMDSCGLGGELPSSLSNLKNLRILWASDNSFSGKIPDFIGSLTNLNSLRFQGNSFEGPIPSNFSCITKLTDLRIGDIINGSSSLTFVSNLTSLTNLILRNSGISDIMPANFASYTSLQKLDLSFNNISGLLPQSLFNLNSINYLFLGNNSISGSLPNVKSRSLSTIDLSYNQLSGSFPSWVGEQNLSLNLVANNFVIDGSTSSVLPPGLNCLQRNIPCYLGSPIYSSFAIKCGGNTTASDGIVYDNDNTTLTAASYYVTDTNKWGVSNVGSYADASLSAYISMSLPELRDILRPELQASRMSPSSLRYYGLGLENGNYRVQLLFFEADYLNSPSWRSLGRRVFNIYIQGKLEEKDFNIVKEAGGLSFKTVNKEYIAPVSNNFLEIHLFWAGKGTCCVPTQGSYGPTISAISVSPFDFNPTVSNKLPIKDTNKSLGLVVGIVVAVGVLLFLTVIGVLVWRQRKRRLSKDVEQELSGLTVRPDTFSYAELRAATDGFDPVNLLGQGGFGVVYKGKLSDGRPVAVKKLSMESHQGKRQFIAEVATISAVQHRNLVKLYGCCIEGDKRLLIYEYLENKSLDQAIFGKSDLYLDWSTRLQVCLGTARGLAYLHEESRVRIVHRDVKASNILLDADLNPKLSDFGLAKLYDDKKSHISTRVAGTIGYLAPEYAMRGHLTEKADVFGFGVVVLEILTGRRNVETTLDEEKIYILDWAWHLYENKREMEMLDPKLTSFDEEEAHRFINVALLCTQVSPTPRPQMSRVVGMLAGDIEVAEVTTRPGYFTEWQLKDLSSNFTTDDFSEALTASTSNTTIVNEPRDMSSPSQPLMHTTISED